MANTIRLKRRVSGNVGAPATLLNAECAFNEVENVLYYGKGLGQDGNATSVIAIGGDGVYATKSYVTSAVSAVDVSSQLANYLPLTGGTISSNLTVTGNLTVNGTTTNINSTDLVVEDKTITLGDTASPSDASADGGGIALKGTTDKTLTWSDSIDAWSSSEHVNVASGKGYYVNGTAVLSGSTLGSGVTASSLTGVGVISSGTWQGTAVAVGYGGLGLTAAITGLLKGNGTGYAAATAGTDYLDSSSDINGGTY
jgi:hypothetical protein